MNVIDLITLLRDPKRLNELMSEEFPAIDVDQIDVYVRSQLASESEVKLFDAELISNKLEMEVNGELYINLFPLYMIREFVEHYPDRNKLDCAEIAKRLIEFRVKDA